MAKQKKLVLTSLEDLKAWQEAKKIIQNESNQNDENEASDN